MNKFIKKSVVIGLVAILTLSGTSTQVLANSSTINSDGSVAEDSSNVVSGESSGTYYSKPNGVTGYDDSQNKASEYTEVSDDETVNTQVYLSRESSAEIVIPKTIILDGQGSTDAEYKIQVEGDIAGAEKIYVGPEEKNIPLYSRGKEYIKCNIEQSKYLFTSSEIVNGTETEGSVYTRYLTAGMWHGNFNIDVDFVDYTKEEKIPSISEATYVYVDPNGSDVSGDGSQENPFASIWKANASITDASPDNKYVVKVADGEYNDLERIFTEDYIESLDENTINYYGYIAKNNVYYLGNAEHPENVVINWDFSKEFNDPSTIDPEDVKKAEIFHIFHSVKTAISGFTMNAKNTLRVVHVETTGTGVTKECHYSISNCILNYLQHDTSFSIANSVVSCGGNDGDFGVWRNVEFNMYDTSTQFWGVHDNIANDTNGEPGTYIHENCTYNLIGGNNRRLPQIETSSQGKTAKVGNVIIIGATVTNGDGPCQLQIIEGTDFRISAYGIDTTTDRKLVYDDNVNDTITYSISNKDIITNKFTVKTNKYYRITLEGENADDYYISGWRLYKMVSESHLFNAGGGNLGSSVIIDTHYSSNQTNPPTQADISIHRKDNTVMTSSDLEKVRIKVEHYYY